MDWGHLLPGRPGELDDPDSGAVRYERRFPRGTAIPAGAGRALLALRFRLQGAGEPSYPGGASSKKSR
jgi:hypothetical protein